MASPQQPAQNTHPDAIVVPNVPVRPQSGGADMQSGWIRFRQYEISPGARSILANGRPINLGGRAFDLLVVLLNARGTIVSKAEIFDKVWPATTVEESNLRFQIATLRAALGRDRDAIKTVSGRGYLLADDNIEARYDDHQRVRGDDDIRGRAESVCGDGDPDPIVVIIEDDQGVREALEGLLLSTGLQPICFPSIEAYLQAGGAVTPACLILDVWLPGMSGIEYFETLAQRGQTPSVIFISGHADVHMSVRAMKAGAIEFLTKPVRHQDLLSAVRGCAGQLRTN